MKGFGHAIGAICAGLLRVALHGLVLTGRLVALLAVPVAAWLIYRMSSSRRRARVGRASLRRGQALLQAQGSEVTHAAAPTDIPPLKDFDVADRIVSLRLDPPVGVINLRVYHALGIVKRDLIVCEPFLRTLMKGRRHVLPDLPYDPVAGLDAIKDETTRAVEGLINELGNRGMRAKRRGKVDTGEGRPAARLAAPPATASGPATKEDSREGQASTALPPQSSATAEPPLTAVVAPKVTMGFTYVGTLAKAGFQIRNPKGRPAYEVFEATLQLENGAELALRGAELERELTASGCIVGERVAITPMGKVPVSLGNGSEGQKNLYKVNRMERPVMQ